MTKELIERLYVSDAASALTNEAARALEALQARVVELEAKLRQTNEIGFTWDIAKVTGLIAERDALRAQNEALKVTITRREADIQTMTDAYDTLRAELAALRAQEPVASLPDPTEFCWLVELFRPHGGNSLGYYHTGFTDLGGESRSTNDPHKAKRYSTFAEADKIAKHMLNKQGVWVAVEHGFHSAATPVPPVREPLSKSLGLEPDDWNEQAAREPLSDDQIFNALGGDESDMRDVKADPESWAVILEMAHKIEAAHGIKEQK